MLGIISMPDNSVHTPLRVDPLQKP